MSRFNATLLGVLLALIGLLVGRCSLQVTFGDPKQDALNEILVNAIGYPVAAFALLKAIAIFIHLMRTRKLPCTQDPNHLPPARACR